MHKEREAEAAAAHAKRKMPTGQQHARHGPNKIISIDSSNTQKVHIISRPLGIDPCGIKS
jgi:hypothetical protein